MIYIIDNYDSFTYNLVQLVGQHTPEFSVVRNDKVTIAEMRKNNVRGIIISPGPGRPENAGICVEVIRELGSTIPILGVCLGHQAIGYAFGARIVHAPVLMHGKISRIRHHGTPLFDDVSNPFEATRYHSLIIEHSSLPKELKVTAMADENIIMGIQHERYPIQGIQFHPESVLTTVGGQIISNWMHSIHNRMLQ